MARQVTGKSKTRHSTGSCLPLEADCMVTKPVRSVSIKQRQRLLVLESQVIHDEGNFYIGGISICLFRRSLCLLRCLML